ncbi:MAG: hypothetical protein HRT35_06130 [Algicola sp.]|nr:hypothetical protein [Algicola sp.]
MKIGSAENPLRTALEKVDRPLLNKHISTTGFEFKDLKVDDFKYFLYNLAGNEFLSKMAIRIGVFFYQYFDDYCDDYGQEWEEGCMFITADPDSTTSNNFEEHLDCDDNCFNVRHDGKKLFYDLPLPNLVSLLAEKGINISSSNLFKVLKELHEYHYLTMSPAPIPAGKKHGAGTRSPWRHIRLYRGMLQKPFFCHLKDK